ncbi:MAG: hypothetical protein JXX29_24350 [Deltaproteobacteria bacterium]|nr:hypothetical protein [Deltaproteobacteria bacterium]MBN2674835.1 hypothetical protein [Deltaproteobacteria bacterium]
MTYSFFILCLLLLIPGAVIFAVRKDLRHSMAVVAACAVPFAFTEFLFYPSYWEPKFLFHLADKIGFGIEDFLFVTGLGAFTSAVYPTVFFLRLQPSGIAPGSAFFRGGVLIATALLLAALFALFGVPMIWGCVPIMVLIAAVIVWMRRDLSAASLWGGVLSAVSYYLMCLGLAAIVPDVFILNWHAEKFSGIYVTGVPLEEIGYAFGAGTVAAVFYPFVFSNKFEPTINQRFRSMKPFSKSGLKTHH